MPIQWTGDLQSPEQLASVIQGEAATPAGQFAVASVMYNRMITDGFGSSVQEVVTPTQFNGYNSNPSPYAQQLADTLWNTENPPPGGDPGNALFFAAPSSSNASWANPNTQSGQGLFSQGTNIGGNYFSDQLGPPSSDYQAPVFGGNAAAVSQYQIDPQNNQVDTFNGQYTIPGQTEPNAQNYTLNGSAAYTGFNGTGNLTNNGSVGDTLSYDNSGATSSDSGGGLSDISGIIGGLGGAGGIAQAIIKAGNTVGPDTSKAGQTVSSGVGAAASAIDQTASGITTGVTGFFANAFYLFAAVVLGVVFVYAGLAMFRTREAMA